MSLAHALLGFLNYQPSTGYELKQIMDLSTSNFWYAKQSQIYTTLKTLETDGCVVSHIEAQGSRPDRRVYTITTTGQAMLHDWLSQPVIELPQRKELLLLKLFFSARQNKQHILTQLRLQHNLYQQEVDRYKNETKSIIQQVTATIPGMGQDALLWDATRRYGEMFAEMNIRWLNEIIVLVEQNL